MATVSDSVDSLFDPQPDPKQPVPSELADFLAALFDGLPGFIELRVIDPEGDGHPEAWFAANPDVAAQMILRLREKFPQRNLYHALATRVNWRSGTKRDLHALRVLWADCDSMGPTEAVEVAEIMGLPAPSIVVGSGKGAHLYWLLAEPLDVRDSTAEGKFNIGAVESRLRGICEAALGDWSVTDASRVLRPPATTNNPTPKKRETGRVPAPVELVSFNPERRYTLAHFDMFQAPPRSRAKAVAIEDATWPEWAGGGEEDLPEPLRELLAKHELLALHFRREVDSTGDTSADDYRLGCLAARYRCPEEEIYQLLAASRRAYVGDDKSERDDYFRRTALACFEEASPPSAAEQFSEIEVPTERYQPQWERKPEQSGGGIIVNEHNAIEAIRALGIRPARNAMRGCEEMRGELSTLKKYAPGVGAFVGDAEIQGIRLAIKREFGFMPGKSHAWDAIEMEGGEHHFDPLREMLEGLEPWDGEPRIETFFIEHANAPDTPLVRCYSRLFFLGAVARAFVPGIKLDTMTVLIGPQGCGKSTLLKIIAGEEFFREAPSAKGLKTADVVQAIQGRWILEFAELGAMRHEHVEAFKEFLSTGTDRARFAYGRKEGEYPRRCAFVGTTNRHDFLKDCTGNRRFNPIVVGSIDLEAAAQLRGQLLEEAVTLWERKPRPEALQVPPELRAMAEEDRENFMAPDARADRVAEWLDTFAGPVVKLPTALERSLGVAPRNAKPQDTLAVTETLGRHGWRKGRHRPAPDVGKVAGYWRPGWLDKPAEEREREWAEWQRAQRVEPE